MVTSTGTTSARGTRLYMHIPTVIEAHSYYVLSNSEYKLDAESRELRDLESRGPDVASRS